MLINTGLITSETAEVMATNVVTAAKLKELVATGKLTQAEANLIAAKAGVTLADQKESASLLADIGAKIKGTGTALKGLGTGILTIAQAHPIIASITAALTFCGGVAFANKVKHEKAAKEIKKAYEDATTAINDINNTFNEKSSKTKETSKEYAELAQGVNLLTNENKKLSTEKYERFLDLSNQLSALYPPLTKSYDKNGNAILDLSGDVDTIIGSLDNLIERQRILNNQEIMKRMPDLFAGYSNSVSDYKKQLTEAEKRKKDIQTAYEEINKYGLYTAFDISGNAKDADNNPVALHLGQYAHLLKMLGITTKEESLPGKYGETIGYKLVVKDSGESPNLSDVKDAYISAYNKASDDVKYAKQQLEVETSSINQYLNTWLQTEFSYTQIENSGLQKAVQDTLFNFNWSHLPEEIDKNNWEAVSEYLRRNILFSISNISSSDVSKALADIYSGNLTTGEFLDAIAKVQKYFGSEHPISIPLQAKVDDTQPLINNVKGKLQDDFYDKVGELTLDELKIAVNLEVSEEDLLSWDELIAKIIEAKGSATLSTKLTNSADSLDAFQSSVKSAVDAYATLLSGNYSSTDLLNSIQAINKAATDMGESIRWEEIDSLDALGDQIEEISQAYADSVLSDAGLSKDSKFGQMLTDIIRASYQSEAALSSLNTQIDSLQDSYRNLNDIVDTYNEHGHITFDQLQTLLDMEPRYLSCLVSEDGQLRLNQDAMQELAAMRLADARALIIQQAVTELGELAQKRETKAVEDNTMALTDNMETLTTYEQRIIDLLPGLGLTGNEFCRISNAINGAMQDGASDEDIDEVLRNAAKKAKFITGMADGNIDDMFGSFSSAAVSATEELNSYLDAQEKALDAGKISFREYCDSISSHIRKAYDSGKISAKEFWDYQGQFLEKQKSSYDKVISAVTRKLDGEIDALRDRQDEIDGFYESQISSLEETRKLLQENNDERKRQADLQKALYEMERAHNQRTVLQYSEGMGMHYVSDSNAVRDAENSVADARLNVRTAEIDSAISRLERQRDSEKSAIDEIIRNLEAYKAKWSEVSSAFEEAQEDQLAAEILGQEWEADVLGMRIDTLSAFAENYVNLQRTIADAAWESAKAQAEAQKLINEQTSDAPGNRSAAIKKVADYGAGIANALRDKFDLSKHPLKFHTGLKQGLVDTPSLNRDFKLVQDVGLGRNEVPAVLKKGEIVATQEQVSNLAAGLRQAGSQTILVNGMELRALQPGDKTYDLMQKWDTYFGRIDGNVEKLLPGSFFEQREQVTASANHIVSNNVESHNRDVQPTIHNEIHVTLPNVTNATSAETLLKDLQSLGTKKLQVNW